MKPVNPLLPFVLCATSTFVENLDETMAREDFRRSLHTLALVERRLGRAKFEALMARIAHDASCSAWTQLMKTLEFAAAPSRNPATRH